MTTPSRYPASKVDLDLAKLIVARWDDVGRPSTANAAAQIAVAALIDLGWTPPAVIRTHRPVLVPIGTSEGVLEHIRQLVAPYEPAPENKGLTVMNEETNMPPYSNSAKEPGVETHYVARVTIERVDKHTRAPGNQTTTSDHVANFVVKNTDLGKLINKVSAHLTIVDE